MGAGRCGERTKRCRWQRKRSERVAAVKILSVRRKAAQKFWAPQQGHRPLRKRYKECDAERNPPVTASPCQPPLGKGAMGTGVRIATASVRTGLAMTLAFHEGAVCGGAHGPRPTRAFARIAGGQGRSPLRRCVTKKCVGEGLCPSRGRGRTPPLRKRNKRCNGRATARVAPTKALQGVRRGERNSPGTASPCQPPLGKGAYKDGGTDCHGRGAPSQ